MRRRELWERASHRPRRPDRRGIDVRQHSSNGFGHKSARSAANGHRATATALSATGARF